MGEQFCLMGDLADDGKRFDAVDVRVGRRLLFRERVWGFGGREVADWTGWGGGWAERQTDGGKCSAVSLARTAGSFIVHRRLGGEGVRGRGWVTCRTGPGLGGFRFLVYSSSEITVVRFS